MKKISALLNIFIAVFALSLPGTSIVSQFANIIFAAYAGIFTVAFVYDNLPYSEYEKLSFFKVKTLAAAAIIFGSPVFLYAYLWTVLSSSGFYWILATLFYIMLVTIIWTIFLVIIEISGIN